MLARDWFPRKTPVPIGTDIIQVEAIVISSTVRQELRGDCPQTSVTMASAIETPTKFNHAETVDTERSLKNAPTPSSGHLIQLSSHPKDLMKSDHFVRFSVLPVTYRLYL